MFTDKSLLYKLLAEENIHVRFAKIRTAEFNTETRVLTIPTLAILTDGTRSKAEVNDLLDMFGGHEVGHALESPNIPKMFPDPEDQKRLHRFFDYINVIEDIRIERFIKNRYPGLKAPFYRAYNILWEEDFFKFRSVDANEMKFIDRLNVHAKVGMRAQIVFKDAKEHEFLNRAQSVLTFNEVLALAEEIYKWSNANEIRKPKQSKKKEEKKSSKKENADENPLPNNEEGDQGSEENSSGGDDESDETTESSSNDGEEDESEKGESEGSETTDETEDDATEPGAGGDDSEDDKEESKSEEAENVYNISETQRHFDYRMDQETRKANSIRQLKIRFQKYPPIISYKYVLSHPDVNEALNYQSDWSQFNSWMKENEKSVNYLVREFMMKQAAIVQRREIEGDSGSLNNKKLYAYKLTDDLFKRVTSLPNGKNHSLVVLLDWSSSMYNIVSSVIKQAITLADFCRKANIPFSINTFTVNNYAKEGKIFQGTWEAPKEMEATSNKETFMVNLFNNKMTRSEFVKMAKILSCPQHSRLLSMGATPLNSAILNMVGPMSNMIKENKTTKNTLIILSDGANTENLEINDDTQYDDMMQSYIVNPINNISYRYDISKYGRDYGTENTISVLKMIKDTTKCNIMWMFITDNINEINLRVVIGTPTVQDRNDFNKNGVISKPVNNIDLFQVINNKKIRQINNYGSFLPVIGAPVKKQTARVLKNNLVKQMNGTIFNKVILNQWIEAINK